VKRLTARRVRKLRREVAQIREIRLRLVELPKEIEMTGEIPQKQECAQ
jgi:hypothetical protein